MAKKGFANMMENTSPTMAFIGGSPVKKENRSKHVHLQWQPSYYAKVERFAQEHGTSVNSLVLEALKAACGLEE